MRAMNVRPLLWGVSASNNHKTYAIDGRNLREERLISEGAYAFVYLVRDVSTSETFALKKIICQETDRKIMAQHEISIWKSIPAHNNLVQYLGHTQIKSDKVDEILILMELCNGGHLLAFLDKVNGKLTEDRIIWILKEIVQGIDHLHTLPIPVAHRDIKVENILFNDTGQLKICDFGSASTHFIDTMTCSKDELNKEISAIEQYTTMLYRAPEMISLHREYRITVNVDIWMIGCILFILAFYKHPFQNSSSLAITNAKFEIPHTHNFSRKLTDLIIWMLSIEPLDRPSSTTLLEILSKYNQIDSIQMPKHIQERCENYYQSARKDYEMMNTPYKPLDPALISKAKRKQKKLIKQHKTPPSNASQSPSSSRIPLVGNVFDTTNPEIKDLSEFLNGSFKFASTDNNDIDGNEIAWDPFTEKQDSNSQSWNPFGDPPQTSTKVQDGMELFQDILSQKESPRSHSSFNHLDSIMDSPTSIISKDFKSPMTETSNISYSSFTDDNFGNDVYDPFAEAHNEGLSLDSSDIDQDFKNYDYYFNQKSPLENKSWKSLSNDAIVSPPESTSYSGVNEKTFNLDESIATILTAAFNDSSSNNKPSDDR